jgi:hypothetical protein
VRQQIVGKKVDHAAATRCLTLPVCGIATTFSSAIGASRNFGSRPETSNPIIRPQEMRRRRPVGDQIDPDAEKGNELSRIILR